MANGIAGLLGGPAAQGARQSFGQELMQGVQALQQQEQALAQRQQQEAQQTDQALQKGLSIFNALDKAGADDATKQQAWKTHVSPHIDEVDKGVQDVNQLRQITKILEQRQQLGPESAFEAIRAINPVTGEVEEAPQPQMGLQGLPEELMRPAPEEAAFPTFEGPAPTSPFAKIDVTKFTPESIREFEQSGSFADLVSSSESLQNVVTGKDKFNAEKDLRKEFSAESKVFKDTKDSFGRIRSVGGSKTAAGDLALIFNFMKMLDPGSVVRESEFRTAEQAKSWLSRSEETGVIVPSSIKTAIQKVDPAQKGAFLLPTQRTDFMTQASNIMKGQSDSHRRREDTYKGIANRNKLTVKNVVIPFNDPLFDIEELVTQFPDNRAQIEEAINEGHSVDEVKAFLGGI
jgi:hypothetical protein